MRENIAIFASNEITAAGVAFLCNVGTATFDPRHPFKWLELCAALLTFDFTLRSQNTNQVTQNLSSLACRRTGFDSGL